VRDSDDVLAKSIFSKKKLHDALKHAYYCLFELKVKDISNIFIEFIKCKKRLGVQQSSIDIMLDKDKGLVGVKPNDPI
jgi:hypothetical protein